VSVRLGAQWRATEDVAALAGAVLGASGEGQSVLPTAGLAVNLGRLGFAYSYQPESAIDASHQLALSVLLGSTR